MGYQLYSAASTLGVHLRAITVLQIFNIVFSAAAGLTLFAISYRIRKSVEVALFCWALFAFGATWWKFSTDANAYILSVLFLALTMVFLVGDAPRLVPAALCHICGMLIHELAVFTYAVVIAAIALDSARSKTNRFLRSMLYVAATGACVSAIYFFCYLRARPGQQSFFSWITSYASDTGFTHSFAQLFQANGSFLKLTALEQMGRDSGRGATIPAALNPTLRWDLVNTRHHIRLECMKGDFRHQR